MRWRRWRSVVFWAALLLVWAGLGWAFYTYVALPTGWGKDAIKFVYDERNFEILNPLLLGIGLVIPALWAIRHYTLSDLPQVQQHVSTLIRALIILALALGLSRVVTTTFESHVTTVFVVDTSASMPPEGLKKAQELVQAAYDAKGPENDVKLVTFAREPKTLDITPGAEKVPPILRPTEESDRLATDVQSAMRQAYGLFPQDHLKRIVLITDGNQTDGDMLGETYNARDYGIKVSTHTFDFKPRPEVLIRGFTFPENLLVGAPFNLEVEVYSTLEAEAVFQLWQNAYRDGGLKKVTLKPGSNTLEFPTEVFEQGTTRFKLNMRLAQGEAVDTFKPNNVYTETIDVKGKPKVMYIEGERRKTSYLQRALAKSNIDLETRAPSGMPVRVKEYENFDAVMVSDVPATRMSNQQMKVLDQWVRTEGGGFIMVGGDNAFGPGGYYNTYMEQILPVTFDGEKKRDTPSLAMVLVMDKSGSMKGPRIALAKEAAKASVEILQRNDKVAVIAFDDSPTKIIPMQSAANRGRIVGNLGRLRPSGGTQIAPALQEAFMELEATRAAIKHIILLTDGDAPSGNIFTELLPAMQASKITVSTVSVGREAKRSMMQRIAQEGGGRHYYTTDPYNIPKIFTKETSQVARSQIVEEPVQVRLVKAVAAVRGINFREAPYLLGYVSTRAKPRAEVVLTSRYGEPIYARWRRGLGKTAVFTSDIKNRWGVQWLRWPGYPKFWAQALRDLMRNDTQETFPMRLTIERGKGKIVVDAIDKDDAFVNHLAPAVTLLEPLPRDRSKDNDDFTAPPKPEELRPEPKKEEPKKKGRRGKKGKKEEEEAKKPEPPKRKQKPKRKKREFELRQTAPGRYEATFDLTEYGSYVIEVDNKDQDGETVAVSKGTLTWPYPEEYLTLAPNTSLIEKTAEIGQGGLNPTPAQLFDPEGEQVKSKKELWPYFLFFALGLFVLDLLLRRLRLYGNTAIPWEKVAGRG